MTIRRIIAVGLFGAATLPGVALAAGFQNSAQSATSTALGGTGVASTDEPNSSFYNPATMMEANGFRIYLGPTFIIPSTTYEGEGETVETKSQFIPPPNAHVGMTFDSFAVGVGLTFPYGLTIEWPEDWGGAELIQRQQLTTIDVNPNVAYRIADNVSVAAGVQIVSASVELERRQLLRADRFVDVQLAGSALGVGATAAALYRPKSSVALGLNYRSAVKLDFEGRARFEGESDTPFEQTFVDQEVTTGLTTPHTVGVGAAWHSDTQRLNVDVGYTAWSTYDRIDVNFSRPCEDGSVGCTPGEDASNPPTSTIVADWYDSVAFRVGYEYRTAPNFALRVGAAYDRTPIPDETVSPSLPGNHRVVGSTGLGWDLLGVRADLGYQFVYTTRTIENGNQNGEYTTTAHLVGVNLGYGF